MHDTRLLAILCGIAVLTTALPAQTLYTPSGTVGSSANANVGIGTATPAAKLDVTQTVSLSGTSFIVQDANADHNIPLSYSHKVGTTGAVAALGFNFKFDDAGNGAFRTNAGRNGWALVLDDRNSITDGSLVIQHVSSTGAASQYVTFSPAGDVGIGTTVPGAALHLFSTASYAPSIAIESVGDTGAAYLKFRKALAGTAPVVAGTDLGTILFQGYASGTYQQSSYIAAKADAAPVGANVYSALLFVSNHPNGGTSENMRIASSGNVGIGTKNPTQKLSVNGTIQAKEVIVDTGWSDYVFAPDYRLAPLSEVERTIKAEQHLPGIPSAADVAAHGVSLGDMQAKLLEKIEELTLHVIEQDKAIAILRNRNAEIERQLATVEAR